MSQSVCRDILSLDQSIRFVAIANNRGSLIAEGYRSNLKPLLTGEETARYAIQAVIRAVMREDFTSKLGPLQYSIGKYAKLIRAVIPIDSVIPITDPKEQTFLLLSFDLGSDRTGDYRK